MVRRAALLVLTLGLTACAGLPWSTSEAETRFSRAVAALERSDFPTAREDLAWLVARCEAGERGRRALLLLASAELDVRNPSRSADGAARFARAYLALPWVAEEEVPLAQSLYLLAIDLRGAPGFGPPAEGPAEDRSLGEVPGADSVAVAPRFERCGGGGVPEWSKEPPEHVGPTTAERLTRLESELGARLDSLVGARSRLAAQSRTIQELEAEIERIRKLLRGGAGRTPLP